MAPQYFGFRSVIQDLFFSKKRSSSYKSSSRMDSRPTFLLAPQSGRVGLPANPRALKPQMPCSKDAPHSRSHSKPSTVTSWPSPTGSRRAPPSPAGSSLSTATTAVTSPRLHNGPKLQKIDDEHEEDPRSLWGQEPRAPRPSAPVRPLEPARKRRFAFLNCFGSRSGVTKPPKQRKPRPQCERLPDLHWTEL